MHPLALIHTAWAALGPPPSLFHVCQGCQRVNPSPLPPWFTPPAAPAPLPLAQRVEGVENPPLLRVTRALRTSTPSFGTRSVTPVLPGSCPPPRLPLPHIVSTTREGRRPPPPSPLFPAPHARLPNLRARTCAKGRRARGRVRAERQSSQHSGRRGRTVAGVPAAQRVTQAGELQASGRAGARRGVRGEVVSHDGTPACAYKGRGCVSGVSCDLDEGAVREWKGRARVPYSHLVDQLRKKHVL